MRSDYYKRGGMMKATDIQKSLELFDNLLNEADSTLLHEFKERLDKEIRLSEQAIKEGFEVGE